MKTSRLERKWIAQVASILFLKHHLEVTSEPVQGGRGSHHKVRYHFTNGTYITATYSSQGVKVNFNQLATNQAKQLYTKYTNRGTS